MTNYTKYSIVYGNTLHDITQGVQAEMADGWQPIGGIAVETDQDALPAKFYQAIVK
jgi:hypothetical protein